MNTISHPSSVLDKGSSAIIKDNALHAENAGWLTDTLLELAYKQNWLQLLTPACYGGMEMPLPDAVAIEEAIAYNDGSMGWVITLCAGAGWFGGFIDPLLAQHIFKEPSVCVAGSGSVSGTAEISDDGYILNGTWQYATGTPCATVFTANCYITQNGQQLKDEQNNPIVRAFILLKDEVIILPTWNKMGMIATASHSFKVSNLSVNTQRAFDINTTSPVIDAPLYRYPFLQLAEVTLTANISGIAMHFITLCEDLFRKKKDRKGTLLADTDDVRIAMNNAHKQMDTARQIFHDTLHTSWQACVAGTIDTTLLQKVSSTSHILTNTARTCVNNLYPYCGLFGAEHDNELNRVWRDLHTAAQHPLLVFAESNE